MSLLEDVFLEDEAGEARELERVIEGDEYDERPLSPNSDDNEEKGDEAEEDKRRVDPSEGKVKKIVKNPRFVLNPARLTGPRGIQVIPDHFKNFKFRGKGCEKEDLDMVLKKLEHWAYRLYPKFEFVDCLKKIETLGRKRSVMVHLHKIRSDQLTSEDAVVQNDLSDEELPTPPEEDEFDKLLQQQIERTSVTPAAAARTPRSVPSVDRSLLMPKATSSPSINEEQKERMLRNRRFAEERRLAKLNNNSGVINETADDDKNIQKYTEIDGVAKLQDDVVVRKHNRSNVIDSSSDDDDEMSINHHTTVENQNKNAENYAGIESNVQGSNVNDSSSDNDYQMSINHPITIKAQNKNGKNNTGFISNIQSYNDNDSLSDDDDEMSINQSITVDIHKNKENLSKSSYNQIINQHHVDVISENTNLVAGKADNVIQEEAFGNNENESNINVTDYEKITDHKSDDNVKTNDVITNIEDAKNKMYESTHNKTDITKDDVNDAFNDKNYEPELNVLKDKTPHKIQSETKEHSKLNDDAVLVNQETITNIVDAVMDVDFDDDF